MQMNFIRPLGDDAFQEIAFPDKLGDKQAGRFLVYLTRPADLLDHAGAHDHHAAGHRQCLFTIGVACGCRIRANRPPPVPTPPFVNLRCRDFFHLKPKSDIVENAQMREQRIALEHRIDIALVGR